jgi:hypothetical protein
MRGTVAYLAAQEHVNDLIRDAELARRHAEVRSRSRVALTLPSFAARWMPKTRRPRRAAAARAQA